jgi:uncharacterized membrane protein
MSCTQEAAHRSPGDAAPVIANDTLKVVKDLKGIYENTSRTFRDCGHPELIYKVKDLTELNASYKKILPNAYASEAIYLEVNAEVSGIDSKIYAGELEIKKINKAEQKNYQNTCIPYEFWGNGTEPFWSLQISKTENLIDYYNPMEQKTIHYLYADPKEETGVIIYNSTEENNPKNKIQISIRKEKCSDGMSDKEYGYRMDVITDRRLSGCAVKFGE